MALLDVLAEWNPWWRTAGVPPELMGDARDLTGPLVKAMAHREAIALTGIRRSGKTTLAYQLIDSALSDGREARSVLYVNLEDPGLRTASLDDIVSAHRQAMGADVLRLLVLDEIQEIPDWAAWVNAQYERRTIEKIVVTGSSMTTPKMGRLLTGRNITFQVEPFSFAEFLRTRRLPVPTAPFTSRDRDHMLHGLLEYTEIGGFPEATRRDAPDRRRLLQQYFMDILARDLAHRRGLDLARIEPFAAYVADTASRPHTGRSLARATGTAPDTARSYLAALEEVYLVRRLQPFTWSPKPAATGGAFKLYLADAGLRNAVTSAPGKDVGRMVESIVAHEIWRRHPGTGFWSDGKHEVDFLVPRGAVVDAIQVCFTDRIPDRETAALHALHEAIPARRRGTRTLLTRSLAGEHDGIVVIPVAQWLLEQASPA